MHRGYRCGYVGRTQQLYNLSAPIFRVGYVGMCIFMHNIVQSILSDDFMP
jgi:hypothetical protein